MGWLGSLLKRHGVSIGPLSKTFAVVAFQKTLILQNVLQPIVYGASKRMNWFCARKWEMIIAMAVINEEKKTSRLPLIIRLLV